MRFLKIGTVGAEPFASVDDNDLYLLSNNRSFFGCCLRIEAGCRSSGKLFSYSGSAIEAKTGMLLNSFSTAIHGRLPRAVVNIAFMAMINHSQSVQLHTGLNFCLDKMLNNYNEF
ncbi:hypothetical protein KKI24_04340 [bacterium]|nr:hypothetical protein [bacterium]